jgi:hypothetical protein
MASTTVRVAPMVRMLVGLAATLVFAGVASAADEVVRAERWVSRDAVIYVEIPRPAALIDRAAEPRIRALLGAVPGYQERVDKVLDGEHGRKAMANLKALEAALGMAWTGVLSGLTGKGVVAVVEPPTKGEGPSVYLIISPNDPKFPQQVADTVIDLIRKNADELGVPDPVKSVIHRGVTAYSIGPAAYAIVEGKVVFANQAETLKRIIDRALDGLPEKDSIVSDDMFRTRKAAVKPDTLAWGLARVDRLRELDPKRFQPSDNTNTGQMLLLGGWLDVAKRASWVSAAVTWTDLKLAADLTIAAPASGRTDALKGFIPPKGSGAPKLANVPGTVLSASLWRDLPALWEARAELLKPEEVQQLAGLDTFAGQFFGGRDFGSGVLGALSPNWRLVVAVQDYKAMKPAPDTKVPAFALIVDLKPDDPDFAQRIKVAFQSFVGLVNLGAAQTKAPPLELGSEEFEGVTISTSHFVLPAPAPAPATKDKDKDKAKEVEEGKEPVHVRHNFTPSAVQVGDHFVISSSVGLARDLVKALKAPASPPEDATFVVEVDGGMIATLVDLNRTQLVMGNMLQRGNDKTQADTDIGLLSSLLRYLGHARASVKDDADATRVSLEFQLGNPSTSK